MSDRRADGGSTQPPRAPAARTRESAAAVRIDIRQLHLHGYTPVQQQRFVQALETALARMARDGGLPSSTTLSLPRLDLRDAAANPEDAAQQLAQRLFDRTSATRRRDHA